MKYITHIGMTALGMLAVFFIADFLGMTSTLVTPATALGLKKTATATSSSS